MTVSVESIEAEAKCPGGPVKVNENTGLKGIHSISLKNTGKKSVICTVHVSIEAEGARNSNSDDVEIDSGDSRDLSYETYVAVSFDDAGSKTVTAKTSVSGAISKSASDDCELEVKQ